MRWMVHPGDRENLVGLSLIEACLNAIRQINDLLSEWLPSNAIKSLTISSHELAIRRQGLF